MAAIPNDRLAEIKREAQGIADICMVRGRIDGAKAFQAVVEAIGDEQAHRDRGGAPTGG